MFSIIWADVISPFSARCMFTGHTVDTKSAVCGINGKGLANGNESIVAFTKR